MKSIHEVPAVEELLRQYQEEHHMMADVRRFTDVRDDLKKLFREGRTHRGVQLPWPALSERFRLRANELTVVAGYGSHGKTAIMSEIMAHNLHTTDMKWAVASFEMTLLSLAERFVMQCCASDSPSNQFIDAVTEWTDERVWVLDELGSVTRDRVLAFVRFAFRKLGVDFVVVDSLVKCGVDLDHNEPTRNFVDELQHIAKHDGGHVFLVHHLRKQENESGRPSKQDLKGAGAIADLADNVLLVHKNVAKVGRQEKAEEPDARLIVEKQRHFEWTGTTPLYYANGLRCVGKKGFRPSWYGPDYRAL